MEIHFNDKIYELDKDISEILNEHGIEIIN